ncbi:MAG: CDP-diacylglycerol--serine O-phosphatidyltransferase [candidate division Zixibacteria bacterium]|nr:CDP-diacylglycerol--serine O-phosphatidyltransferase [candidate division Zixibacteria bacterium]
MRDLKGIFPGVFTMGNMFCGFLAIIACVRGADPAEPAWLIVLAVFLDILDGRVARLSNSASRFGVELDSLADLVSFAVAPAVMLYSYKLVTFGNWGWILGFIYIMAASFRLARFNLQAGLETKRNFIGLPVPAAAFSLATYVIFSQNVWGEVRLEKLAVTMVIGFALLMVSSIEYESNPDISPKSKAGIFRLLFLTISVAALIYKPRYALFMLSMIYVSSGLVREGYILVKQMYSSPNNTNGANPANKYKRRRKSRNKEKDDDGKSLRFPEDRGDRSTGTDH